MISQFTDEINESQKIAKKKSTDLNRKRVSFSNQVDVIKRETVKIEDDEQINAENLVIKIESSSENNQDKIYDEKEEEPEIFSSSDRF